MHDFNAEILLFRESKSLCFHSKSRVSGNPSESTHFFIESFIPEVRYSLTLFQQIARSSLPKFGTFHKEFVELVVFNNSKITCNDVTMVIVLEWRIVTGARKNRLVFQESININFLNSFLVVEYLRTY